MKFCTLKRLNFKNSKPLEFQNSKGFVNLKFLDLEFQAFKFY